MKGIVLAGGLGTRLLPLTKTTNKHLLPVYNRPMIYYPIQMLVEAGIEEIMIVTGGHNAGEFLRLLGNSYQQGQGGIADALKLTEDFADKGEVVVVLGDNFLEKGITEYVERFRRQHEGARILLKEVDDAQAFGVAEFKDEKLVRIIEKPENPPGNLAVIGVYMYDNEVYDIVRDLKPSPRGELEIADVNNAYIQRGKISWEIVDGWWADAGESFESLFRAGRLVAMKELGKSL
ncbi:Glucose-1-phosphate thymidylyltransferase [subsurface metagenome]